MGYIELSCKPSLIMREEQTVAPQPACWQVKQTMTPGCTEGILYRPPSYIVVSSSWRHMSERTTSSWRPARLPSSYMRRINRQEKEPQFSLLIIVYARLTMIPTCSPCFKLYMRTWGSSFLIDSCIISRMWFVYMSMFINIHTNIDNKKYKLEPLQLRWIEYNTKIMTY